MKSVISNIFKSRKRLYELLGVKLKNEHNAKSNLLVNLMHGIKNKIWRKKRDIMIIISIIIIAILLRTPPNWVPYARDGFKTYWIALLFINGQGSKWLINIFSYFGLFSFSGYPIGGILFVAPLILLFNDITVVFYVYSILCGSIAAISSYILIKKIFDSQKVAAIGSLLYSCAFNQFVTSSLMVLTVRGIFMAFLPIFILKMYDFVKFPCLKNWFKIIFWLMLQFLLHRMAMLLIIWFVLVSIYPIIKNKLSKFFIWLEEMKHYKEKIGILFGIIIPIIAFVLILISSYIIPLHVSELKNDWFTTEPGLEGTMSIILSMCLSLGPILIFTLAGYIIFAINIHKKNYQNIRLFLFCLILSLSSLIFSAKSFYYVPIIGIVCILLAVVPFSNTISSNKKITPLLGILFGLFYLAFGIAYNFMILPIDYFLYIFIILGAGMVILGTFNLNFNKILTGRRLNERSIKKSIFYLRRILIVILFSSLIIFPIFYFNYSFLQRKTEFPYNYVTQEERDVANFLMALEEPVGRILISRSNLDLHIMALTGFYTYYDIYGVSILTTGKVSAQDVKENSSLLPISQWYEQYIFEYHGIDNVSNFSISPSYYRNTLFLYIFKAHLNDTLALRILKEEATRYIITLNSTIVENFWNEFNSPFLQELFNSEKVTLRYQSEHIYVWDIINLLQ